MKQTLLSGLACLLLLAGCQDLAVENPNNPDRTVAFAQPGDVANLISGTFQDYWLGIQNCSRGALFYSTIADENSSSVGQLGHARHVLRTAYRVGQPVLPITDAPLRRSRGLTRTAAYPMLTMRSRLLRALNRKAVPITMSSREKATTLAC